MIPEDLVSFRSSRAHKCCYNYSNCACATLYSVLKVLHMAVSRDKIELKTTK